MAMGVKRKTPTARLSRYVVRSWKQFPATLQNMRTQPSRRNTHTNVLFAERSCLRCLNTEGQGSRQAKLRRASRLLMSVLKSGGRGLPKTHGTSLYDPPCMWAIVLEVQQTWAPGLQAPDVSLLTFPWPLGRQEEEA